MLIFDLETNGLLPEVSCVHVLVIYNTDTGETDVYDDQPASMNAPIRNGIRRLMLAPDICGHNIIGYDLAVLDKLYPNMKKYTGCVWDTLVMARLAYPEIKEVDFALHREGKLPANLIGSHSLEAWGYRLGEPKGSFDGPWDEWTQEMSDYAVQDIRVTHKLLEKLISRNLPQQAIEIEHEVQKIVHRQTQYGFLFDKEKAEILYSSLLKRQRELTAKLRKFFPPWYVNMGEFTPKRNDRGKGYVAGAKFTKLKYTQFNPASRFHVADRLKKHYGWTPKEFTETGVPKLDESVLAALPYPECQMLAEYYLILKRIGQLAEGKEGWLKNVDKDGRIHGDVNTIGAVTRRMTHSRPNIAQVPRIGTEYGRECRELFIAPPGRVLVGVDASGLELRCLGHYMATYDDGAYAEVVSKGDVHTRTQQATGLPSRNAAKTFIYAFIYGAGDYKIGTIIGKGAAAGKNLKAKFLAEFPALAALKSKVENVARNRGVLLSLDGAPMKVRSLHSALNTLLQGAGALIMKKALIEADYSLRVLHGLTPGQDYEFVANIHDEWQIECKAEYADLVGQQAVKAIRIAGTHFNLRCPLDGEYKVGKTWAETH